MPNFPKVDAGNPYLSRRYDMDIIDSKPWGHGRVTETGSWVQPTCPEAQLLSTLEGRHAFALGHLINHPGAGTAL